MRCRRALALLLAAGMLCSGCSTGAISSNYRAVEDLELIQTIGVDRAPEGVCLSAATGKACEGKAPKRMTQSGVSMLAALDQLQDRTPSAEPFYAQTDSILWRRIRRIVKCTQPEPFWHCKWCRLLLI